MNKENYSTMQLGGDVTRLIEAGEFDRTKSSADSLALPDGFTQWNHCDHLLVAVPDGGFTISAQTKAGKRITFHFGAYKENGPPQFVDVQYHDNGTSWHNGSLNVPTFNAVAFGGGQTLFDTRADETKAKGTRTDGRAAIVCILMEDGKPAHD